MVVIDAMSKWIECYRMSNITSTATIAKLKETFSRFGLPKILVTDNGPQLMSSEFQTFLRQNGIQHLCGAPYHAQTNGAAENAVKLIKNCIYKNNATPHNVETIINDFLFQHRNTPHMTTGVTPSKLLLGKNLRCKMDLLLPDVRTTVSKNLVKQKRDYGGKRNVIFHPGETVYVIDFRHQKPSWIKAIVIRKIGNRLYDVKTLEGNMLWKRHVDQMYSVKSSNESATSFIPRSSLNVSNDNSDNAGIGNVEDSRTLRRRSQLKAPDRLQYT